MSRLIFSWMGPLMSRGYKQPLIEEDIPALSESDRTSQLADDFERAWHTKSPSLLASFRYMWGGRMLIGGLAKLLNDGGQFSGPLFLSAIVSTISDRDLSDSEARNRGIVLAVSLFACQIVGALGEAQYFQISMRVGLQLKSALLASVFSKSLRLSQASRESVGGGKLTNVIASDVDSIQAFTEYIHTLWSAPLRIVISLVLLYFQLGVAALAGAGVLIALLPVQAKLVAWMGVSVRAAQQHTDERLRLASETIEGIQIVKCYVWEQVFLEKTSSARSKELTAYLRFGLIRGFNFFLVAAVPVLVALTSFGVYVAIHRDEPLTPAQAFTSLALFNVLRFPLMQLPSMINQLATCKIAINRIQGLLLMPEINRVTEKPPQIDDCILSLKNASFEWEKQSDVPTEPTLRNLNLSLRAGELVAVVGRSGSAKSSLLSAVLGQMKQTDGKMYVTRDQGISYVPQQPWIFSGTLKENVLLGSEQDLDKTSYDLAMNGAALEEDLRNFPNGDDTEIGDRGVTLSGGQRQRVSLARAFYANGPQLVLLDDPLSALDSHVAYRVFREGIRGPLLKGKAILLVTNRLEFAKFADRVLIMEKGEITGNGKYEDLLEHPEMQKLLRGQDTETSASTVSEPSNEPAKDKAITQPLERSSTVGKPEKLFSEEKRAKGSLHSSVLTTYIRAMGVFEISVCALFISTGLNSFGSFWLSKWSSSGESSDVGYFFSIYAGLNAGQLAATLAAQLLLAIGGVRASRLLHAKMVNCLMRTPLSFFHSTPVGRILNRCAKDVMELDRNLAVAVIFCLQTMIGLLGTVAILGISLPWALLAFIPLLALFWRVQGFYRASSREIKRVESVTRSPVFTLFQQAQEGVATLLAFDKEKAMISGPAARFVDSHLKCTFAQFSANRWLAVRLELFGSSVVLVVALVLVLVKNPSAKSGADGALALSSALAITGQLGMLIRVIAMAENSLNSVERIVEYSELTEEPGLLVPTVPVPIGWPSQGALTVQDAVLRYRPGLAPALDSISFQLAARSKAGVVGRTGAGKTSLITALFRLEELESGQLLIDGVDLATISLTDLRKSLGIIPQEPVLFAGSLRYNVDPFGLYSDQAVREALDASHLETFPLTLEVGIKGSALSAGQRQLVCLARVLLTDKKFIALDEATSALDPHTDSLVQTTLRERFQRATVLTVAHRLNTVEGSDKILVLGRGKLLEEGSPNELKSRGGVFAGMLRAGQNEQ